MMGEIQDMAKGMYKDMMKQAKAGMEKEKLGRVNFIIETKLDDGTVLKANSYNPSLLLMVFDEFKKQVKSYPKVSDGSRSSDKKDVNK